MSNTIATIRINEKNTVLPLIGFDEKLKKREELIQMINYLDTEKRKIDEELKLYLGTYDTAESNCFRVGWRTICSNRIDATRLKKELPSVYEKFIKQVTSRRFVVQEI